MHLMIPGPVPCSPRVIAAAAAPPPGHLEPRFLSDFGSALASMRRVFRASAASQPFVIAGSGTLAMELAVQNLIDPGDRAVVLSTGVFSERMAEMARRRGARVDVRGAPVGAVPTLDPIDADIVFVTHVDTSTGVRMDLQAVRAAAPEALLVVDGVCSVAGEVLEMEAWGIDFALTASQKAIGAPPGLALAVAGPRALARHGLLHVPPPLSLDFGAWAPIMRAYEAGSPSYFATPATSLVRALHHALDEIEQDGIDARIALHTSRAAELRAAWATLGLTPVATVPANTLSALWFPDGVGPELIAAIRERGVTVAGGLHPDAKARYFRVGHMGWVLTQPDILRDVVRAIGGALGHPGTEAAAGCISG